MLKSARSDAIGALLILLDLLERNAQTFTQFLLTHALHHAAEPNPAPDMNIDRIGLLLIDHQGAHLRETGEPNQGLG